MLLPQHVLSVGALTNFARVGINYVPGRHDKYRPFTFHLPKEQYMAGRIRRALLVVSAIEVGREGEQFMYWTCILQLC